MMFMLVAKNPNDFKAAVVANFPQDHIQVEPNAWLINTPEGQTSKEIWDRLVGEKMPTGMVVAFIGYYGREPSNVWEWIAAKRNAQ